MARRGFPAIPERVDDWYRLYRWQQRSKQQLAQDPVCAYCARRGVLMLATVADHCPPHRGDWNQFIIGPLQSLCLKCHTKEKRVEEERGYSLAIGDDGYPLDPRHPFNRPTPAEREAARKRESSSGQSKNG
jgi:hypothetical protein